MKRNQVQEPINYERSIQVIGEVASLINIERLHQENELAALRKENKQLMAMRNLVEDLARAAEWDGLPFNDIQQRAHQLIKNRNYAPGTF